MTIAAGTKLGRYEIRAQIGAGGMGEVYLAQDTKLDRKVALKILPAEVAAHPDRMKRFVQEAKTASALNHPNIITIYEIDEWGSSPTPGSPAGQPSQDGAVREGVHFIATEFIDGETLRERMRRLPMKLAEVLDVAAQVASALSAAHAAGIVHRDIKPENTMLRRDGIVKVLDFGLAKLTQASAPAIDTQAATRPLVQTEPGRVMGTVAYMSPEQLRGLDLDARTDIWSLGVVVYEMLAGQAPFSGETSSHIGVSILEQEPAPLGQSAPQAPAELQRIVRKSLAKDRDDRYQTARDLLIDLKNLRRDLDLQSELERSSVPPAPQVVSGSSQVATQQQASSATTDPTPETTQARALQTTSGSAARALETRKAALAIGLLLLMLGVVTAGYWLFGRRATNPTPIESIAVLPFVNASGNAEIEYLSDGMTESLINSLSQLPNLSVKARSSVFRYKGKDVEPQKVAKELSVQAVLNGRIIQRGESLTLSLELVEARTGNQLWGEQYNRRLTDLVELQNEIARDVSDKLRTKLSSADQKKLARNYPTNSEAYQLYLQGRYHWNKRTNEGFKRAIDYFQKAIDRDASYALAYTGLADCYNLLSYYGVSPPGESFPKAKAASKRALEIDETLAEAHTSLAYTLQRYDWDWSAAESEYQRAIELNPNYATAHHWYSEYLNSMARFDEAVAEIKHAQQIDPFSPRISLDGAVPFRNLHQYDRAIEEIQKTLTLDQSFAPAYSELYVTYSLKGRHDEAVAAFLKWRTLAGDSSEEIAALKAAHVNGGWMSFLRQRLELQFKRAQQEYVSPVTIAHTYVQLGERKQAIAWLEKAYETRDELMIYLKVDPRLADLRSEPRFQDLLRRMNFPS